MIKEDVHGVRETCLHEEGQERFEGVRKRTSTLNGEDEVPGIPIKEVSQKTSI